MAIGYAVDIHGDKWHVEKAHVDGGATAWRMADGSPVEIRFTPDEWRRLFPMKVEHEKED